MVTLASLFPVLSHLLVTWLPLVSALWGIVLVAYHQQWIRHRQLVREARLAPVARTWLVVETPKAELVCPHLSCQELVLRRYAPC